MAVSIVLAAVAACSSSEEPAAKSTLPASSLKACGPASGCGAEEDCVFENTEKCNDGNQDCVVADQKCHRTCRFGSCGDAEHCARGSYFDGSHDGALSSVCQPN